MVGALTGAATGAAIASKDNKGTGAVVGGTTGAAAGTATGLATGTATAAAVTVAPIATATGAAGVGATVAGLALGPVGWLLLGTVFNLFGSEDKVAEDYSEDEALEDASEAEEPTASAYTFDCWKAVVHDTTQEPSSGRFLGEIAMDPRVKQVIKGDDDSAYPEIILENIWDEKFRIEYVVLPNNQTAAHAVLMSE